MQKELQWGNFSNYERGLRVLLYPRRENICQSKTYELELTFVKVCCDLLLSHHDRVIVL
jgi:hypothetical protein